MNQLEWEILAGYLIGRPASYTIINSRYTPSSMEPTRVRNVPYARLVRDFELYKASRKPIVDELESEDRSILNSFPAIGAECKVCMNHASRDNLSLRTCATDSDYADDAFACLKENPICVQCAEKMRTNRQNRCPFCRQENVFRKPRLSSAQALPKPNVVKKWNLKEQRLFILAERLSAYYQVVNPAIAHKALSIVCQIDDSQVLGPYYLECALQRELKWKYGLDLDDFAAGAAATRLETAAGSIERRMKAFYHAYNPKRVQTAAAVAADFVEREGELNALLREKYGTDISTAPAG
eukprot:CAMPEP_0181302910 /NCGR_PEP_ID=MMETSP1101-20121128/8256_1 /TAXON_ID=46948 /ORGANISM="Rhodomonas abbreviata, Strain Caron Lab Isolate" /LENGTH=295 /DNA_ID=CAMNT_0023408407 /DNA_START=93 /DNA_END=977 /DNA_ORIENTATION=+